MSIALTDLPGTTGREHQVGAIKLYQLVPESLSPINLLGRTEVPYSTTIKCEIQLVGKTDY